MGHPVIDQSVVHHVVEVLPVVGDGGGQHPLKHPEDPAQPHELVEDLLLLTRLWLLGGEVAGHRHGGVEAGQVHPRPGPGRQGVVRTALVVLGTDRGVHRAQAFALLDRPPIPRERMVEQLTALITRYIGR
jgi:hypothetical protein